MDFLRVFGALQEAEVWHRSPGDPEAPNKLTELGELFARLLDRQIRKHHRYLSHKYYERGNKCGWILAMEQGHIYQLRSPWWRYDYSLLQNGIGVP